MSRKMHGLRGYALGVLVALASAVPVGAQQEKEAAAAQRAGQILAELLFTDHSSTEKPAIQEQVLDRLRQEFGPYDPLIQTLLMLTGRYSYEKGSYRQSAKFFEELVELSTRISGRHHPKTLTSMSWLAHLRLELGEPEAARKIQEEIIETRRLTLGDDHANTLAAKVSLASMLRALGDLAGAKRVSEEVFATQSHLLGKDHPATLFAKAELAIALRELGQYSLARRSFEEILQVLPEDDPNALTVLENYALTARALGDYVEARELQEEALAKSTKSLGEEHPRTLIVKANLAVTLRLSGDLAAARLFQEEIISVSFRILGADHPHTLAAQASLALTLQDLGDLPLALRQQEAVLVAAIRVFGEGHPSVFTTKANLAGTLRGLGRLSEAMRLQKEVLAAVSNRLGKEHPDTLTAKANLANTLLAIGEISKALPIQEEILATRTRIQGEAHPDTWKSLYSVALILQKLGRLDDARMLLARLVTARQKTLGDRRPGTEDEALAFFLLGRVERDLGQLENSFASFTAGLEAIEAQTRRADFSEDLKSRFKAGYDQAYRDALDLALTREKPGDALEILERYRTQSLLTLLHWSQIDSIPRKIRRELTELARRHDEITARLAESPDLHSDQALRSEQTDVSRRREVIQGELIRAKHLAEQARSPLNLQEIRRHLDPGTLLLAYSIGEERGHLFVLTREGSLEVHPVEASAADLWAQAHHLSELDRREWSRSEEARRRLSGWLFDKLLGRAADRIAAADRLLILPDGPLNYLPFAALVLPTESDPRGWQYLVEYKPIHIVQSATVYAELQKRRSVRAGKHSWDWVGFGSPSYAKKAGREFRSKTRGIFASERGVWGQLAELPFTAYEIRNIESLFSPGKARSYLGEAVTEEQVREALVQARIVHFATHGTAEVDPQDSFLALSQLDGGVQNGLLQAWEIAGSLKLEADLVVLSVCQSAIGPNQSGEGLISLSRAFQIAGARSVLASLWAVNDRSTAELMIRFYRHLLGGKPKDQALQAAQLELIRGPIEVVDEKGEKELRDFSAPYHWAAFQLIGDWK